VCVCVCVCLGYTPFDDVVDDALPALSRVPEYVRSRVLLSRDPVDDPPAREVSEVKRVKRVRK
jgi:hypothetical protein